MYFNIITLVLSIALGTSAAPVVLTDPSIVTYGSVVSNDTTVNATSLSGAALLTGAKAFSIEGFRRSAKFGRDGIPDTIGPLIPVDPIGNDTSSDNSTEPGLERIKSSSEHLAEFVGFRREN